MPDINGLEQILEREETLRLSERDSMTFLNALENPPPPSKKLIAAFKAHNRLSRSHALRGNAVKARRAKNHCQHSIKQESSRQSCNLLFPH